MNIKPRDLRGKSILITGATGVVGRSILDYLDQSRLIYGDEIKVTVLSRNVDLFLKKYPSYTRFYWLQFLEGNITNLPPPDRTFTDVIHAAADTHFLGADHLWRDQIVHGTVQALKYANAAKAKRFLYISSGAVYGPHEDVNVTLHENYDLNLQKKSTRSIYGEAKKTAEDLAIKFSNHSDMKIKIARLFTIISQHMPIPGHYAITNFLHDARFNDTININGNKNTLRSYLDGRDMAHWLITILLDGQTNAAYNVGSDRALTMIEIAECIRKIYSPSKAIVCHSDSESKISVYVPNVEKCKNLGLNINYTLEDSLEELKSLKN